MPSLPPGYALRAQIPAVKDYLRLRAEAGLTPHNPAAARAGLPNSFAAVQVAHEGEVVGMGRVVGDGGLFFQIVDIAVLPAHQGKGLGKAIMGALMEALVDRLRSPAYVSLIADGDAKHLYRQYGFEDVMPKSIGMAQWLDPEGG